jgi:hypothetical protein
MKLHNAMHRLIAAVIAAVMLITVVAPTAAHAGSPTDDLKQIEYKYYFRGKYQQAIEALRTYLARVDLPAAETLRAREFLAASYVLAGAPDMGKQVFTGIITADPAYAGPDPSVFKLDVMDAYAKARSDYAALVIKTAPQTASASPTSAEATPATKDDDDKKPIYKQWWLYAGVAAVAIAVGAAAGGGGGGGDSDRGPTGTIVVGVTVK